MSDYEDIATRMIDAYNKAKCLLADLTDMFDDADQEHVNEDKIKNVRDQFRSIWLKLRMVEDALDCIAMLAQEIDRPNE